MEIATPGDRRLSFDLGDRAWLTDAGDIPCGEVYISPIEESGEGKVLVPEVYLTGNRFDDVELEFRRGRLVSSSESELLDQIRSHSDDADMLAEFGIGLNPSVKRLIGHPSVDEKCGGTVHIAIGMNHLAGGNNFSSLHLDLVFPPVRVLLDGEPLMEGRRLIPLMSQRAE